MSLAMCATATIIAVEVGLTVYNLNKAGAFNSIKKKFNKVKLPDVQVQPTLRSLKWNYSSIQ